MIAAPSLSRRPRCKVTPGTIGYGVEPKALNVFPAETGTVILTAGAGPFEAIAPRVAAQASRFMGFPSYSILPGHIEFSSLPHPAWAKAFIWDFVPVHVERIVWVDADAVCIRPFGTLPGGAFAAVEDCDSTFQGERAKLSPVNECRRYFNSGMFVCTRQARPVFDELKDMMFGVEHGGCLEQSWLNVLVQRRLGGVDPMPRGCNWLPICSPVKPNPLRVVHFAGWDMRYRIPALEALLESLSAGKGSGLPELRGTDTHNL